MLSNSLVESCATINHVHVLNAGVYIVINLVEFCNYAWAYVGHLLWKYKPNSKQLYKRNTNLEADSPLDSSATPTPWNPDAKFLEESYSTPKLPKVSLHLSVSGTRICCAMITFWFSWTFTRENLSCKSASSGSKSLELSARGELDFFGVPITPGLRTLDFWLDFGFHSLLCCEAAWTVCGHLCLFFFTAIMS